jgi:hypothetical protein
MTGESFRRLRGPAPYANSPLSSIRMEIRPLRLAHAEKIREALQPTIEAAARAIISTLAEFNAAVTVLNSYESEFDQAGGEARYVRLPANFGAIEHHARSLLEEFR